MFTRIRKAMDEKDQGFTLIELLVVMIIIGILAAIAIPTFMSQKSKAKDTSAKADVKALATSVETALTDGDPAAAETITSAPGVATFAVNGTTFTSRLSSGNVAAGDIAIDGTYCVSVATAENDTDNKHIYSVKDGQLTQAAC